MTGILFFGGIYAVLALPFILALRYLLRRLASQGTAPLRGAAICALLGVLLLTPYLTQMATLFAGFVPIGYFILSAPFYPDDSSRLIEILVKAWRLHVAGMLIVSAVTFTVAWRQLTASKVRQRRS